MVAVVASIAALGLTSTALVDNEVTRRLATVPVTTTTELLPTTTTVVPRPSTPRQRHTEPVAVTVVAEAATTTTGLPTPLRSTTPRSSSAGPG